jgi:nicotinamide-nucleotide amidase
MELELVTIGTELLLGFTLDTNGAEIGRALAAQGIRLARRTSVPDRSDDIRDAVGAALRRTGAVLTTGGLGPTNDDVTKQTVAGLFGTPIVFDEALWQALLKRYARYRRTPTANNRSQAEIPQGAVVLPNRWGSAPGLWLEGAAGLAIMLPGVPGAQPPPSRVLPRSRAPTRWACRSGTVHLQIADPPGQRWEISRPASRR